MKKAVVGMAVITVVLTVGLALASGAGAIVPDGTEGNPFGPGDKVAFRHYDGSDTGGGSGKYNSPDASTTATGPAGHSQEHAFDVIPSYWFQQNANAPVEFFAGVNWPTLNNLPTSPVDFSPLLGSSASAFIAGGCREPVTSTTAPPCPNGTVTETVTQTVTTTVAAAPLNAVEETCTVTITTVTTTTATTTPPRTTTAPGTTTVPAVTTTTVPAAADDGDDDDRAGSGSERAARAAAGRAAEREAAEQPAGPSAVEAGVHRHRGRGADRPR